MPPRKKTDSSRRRLRDEPSPPPPPPATGGQFFSQPNFQYQSHQFPIQPAYNQFSLDQYQFNPYLLHQQQQPPPYFPDTSHFRDSQQNSYVPDTSQFRDTQEDTEEEEEETEEQQQQEETEEEPQQVDETQEQQDSSDDTPPSAPKSKGRKGKNQPKKKQDFTHRVKRRKWVEAEEVALVKSYISVSVDRERGNSIRTDSLWQQILDNFTVRMRETDRSVHQVNSKWKDLQKKVNQFQGFYTTRDNARHSGWNDVDVLKAARQDYREMFKNPFEHEAAWEILRDHEKWRNVGLAGDDAPHRSSKRSKTSDSNPNTSGSDAQFTGFTQDLDDDETPPTPATARQRKGKQPATSRQDEYHALLTEIGQMNQFNREEAGKKKSSIGNKN